MGYAFSGVIAPSGPAEATAASAGFHPIGAAREGGAPLDESRRLLRLLAEAWRRPPRCRMVLEWAGSGSPVVRASTIIAVAAALAVGAPGCAVVGPARPPGFCFQEHGGPDSGRGWVTAKAGELPPDVAFLSQLAELMGGPRASYERDTWLSAPDGELRLCRWIRSDRRWSREAGWVGARDSCVHGRWWDFDLSEAQPAVVDTGGQLCLT